jgi:periplasmic divalent cation tolerance protein
MLYITTTDRDEAMRIARALVSERLVACVNLIGEATSVYQWQGEVVEAQEVVLIAKTRRDLADAALARIKALHSYDTPCAVVYDMATGLPNYLAWINAETTLGGV